MSSLRGSIAGVDYALLDAARLAQAVYASGSVNAALLKMFPTLTTSTVRAVQAVGGSPQFEIFKVDNPSIWIVTIAGTEGIAQILSYSADSVHQVYWHGLGSTNNTFATAAESVIQQFMQSGPQIGEAALFIGHSLGGVVAELCAAYWAAQKFWGETAWVSYGAPQCGNKDMADSISRVSGHRMMNDGDPVPYMPGVNPLIATTGLGVGLAIIATSEGWAQPKRGTTIGSNGDLNSRNYPGGFSAAQSLLTFLIPASSLLIAVKNHGIGEYVSRLAKATQNQARQSTAAPPSAAATTRGAQMAAIPVPMSNARIPGRHKFLWTFVSNHDWVAFEGKLVLQCFNKSQAKTFCKRANSLLQRIQTGRVCKDVDFSTAWRDYLLAATTPGSGFTPEIPNNDF